MCRMLRFLLLLEIVSSFSSSFSSATCCDGNLVHSADSLDSTIRTYAFEAVMHRRRGVAYRVPLPANLSSIEVSVMKLSGNSFWRNGVKMDSFRIPPKTFTVPRARRLATVYQNLGEYWSSCYYNVQNYSAATPAVGILAYNMNSNSTKPIDFRVINGTVSVTFPYVSLPQGLNRSSVKCVRFGLDGSGILHDTGGRQGCSTTRAGHFMMVFPSPEVPKAVKENDERRLLVVWAVVGGVLLVMLAVAISVLVKRKRMQEMEREADEGVVLDKVWVGGSKMPSASMVRTRPALENGGIP